MAKQLGAHRRIACNPTHIPTGMLHQKHYQFFSMPEKFDSDLVSHSRSPGFPPELLACHIFCAFHFLLLRCSCAPRGGHLCTEK